MHLAGYDCPTWMVHKSKWICSCLTTVSSRKWNIHANTKRVQIFRCRHKGLCLKLHQNIYIHKQAGIVWNHYLTKFLINKVVFKQSSGDYCVFYNEPWCTYFTHITQCWPYRTRMRLTKPFRAFKMKYPTPQSKYIFRFSWELALITGKTDFSTSRNVTWFTKHWKISNG